MAQVTITNLTASPVHLGDIYHTLAASSSITIDRTGVDLTSMPALQRELAAGNVSVSISYSSDETGSGLTAPSASVEARDVAPVAAATAVGGLAIIRASMAAGGGGSPDDVTVYAAGALPFKFRVVDAWAVLSAGVAGTVMAYTQAAAAGTKLCELDTTSTGPVRNQTMTASAVATPGATEGLFLRRSDNAAAGEVFLLVRPES